MQQRHMDIPRPHASRALQGSILKEEICRFQCCLLVADNRNSSTTQFKNIVLLPISVETPRLQGTLARLGRRFSHGQSGNALSQIPCLLVAKGLISFYGLSTAGHDTNHWIDDDCFSCVEDLGFHYGYGKSCCSHLSRLSF